MISVQGKSTSTLTAEAFAALRARFGRVAIDLGTGDGRFAYRLAQEQPETLVIGMDPVREAMREFSSRAGRKPAKGGLDNLIYIVAGIEQPPEELAGVAGEIHVNLPWGSLMRGLMLGDALVVANLAGLAVPDGTIRIILNTRIFADPIPLEARDLPELTPDYVAKILAPVYLRHGLEITTATAFAPEALLELGTSWARRLSHRTPPPSFLIECRRVEATPHEARHAEV